MSMCLGQAKLHPRRAHFGRSACATRGLGRASRLTLAWCVKRAALGGDPGLLHLHGTRQITAQYSSTQRETIVQATLACPLRPYFVLARDALLWITCCVSSMPVRVPRAERPCAETTTTVTYYGPRSPLGPRSRPVPKALPPREAARTATAGCAAAPCPPSDQPPTAEQAGRPLGHLPRPLNWPPCRQPRRRIRRHQSRRHRQARLRC